MHIKNGNVEALTYECFADLVIAGLGNEAGIIGAAFLGQ